MANNLLIPCTFLFDRETGDNISPTPLAAEPVPTLPYSFATITYPGDTSRGSPPDTPAAQPRAYLDAIETVNARGGVYEIQVPGGTPIRILNATYASLNASGIAIVDPSDLGNGPGQFPANFADVTVDLLLTAPNVFVRPSTRMRGLYSHQDEQPLGVIPGTPPGVGTWDVLEVGSAPIYSEWVFMLDGQVISGLIMHPLGSDIRRPRDVWNQLIVKAIQQANSQTEASTLLLYKVLGPPGPPGGGVLPRAVVTRMDYLNYARWVAFYDQFGDPIPLRAVY